MLVPFFSPSRTAVAFGPGSIRDLGGHAAKLNFKKSLLVADRGVAAAGYVHRATAALHSASIEALPFHDFTENPDSAQIEQGRAFAAANNVDSIIALGGGSSLDCAKGINFVLSNGGRIQDYWGYDKALQPMLPMIGIPTTTGTGSEAQSYALISDAETHVKMAIGAPGAAFRIVILDPELAVTQPRAVLAASGYDAISHAVETAATTKRNLASQALSREAWRLLSGSFERLLAGNAPIEAAAEMQYGAYLAGAAIEHSMLGAAHATANPLTAHYGTTHGIAISLMLAAVVDFNGEDRYSALDGFSSNYLRALADAAGLPRTLRDIGVPESDIPQLADDAMKQWTGKFNPRPLSTPEVQELYRCVF